MRHLVAADDGGKVTAHAGGLQIVQHAGAVCGGSNGHFAVPGAQRVQQLEQPRPQRHAVLQPCFHLAPYLCGHVVVGEPGAEAFQKCTAAAFVVAPPQQRDILRRHRHAVFARHGAPHLVSQTLGVEHQAVHVEQDGADLLFHCFPNLSSFLCGPAVAEPLFIIHEAVRKANRPPRDGGAEICLSAEKMADLHIFSGLPLVKWPQGG